MTEPVEVGLEELSINEQPQAVVEDEDLSCKIHIGNLAWATTSESLTNYFMEKGYTVHSAQVMSDYNGRSKGWGLAEFNTPEDAQFAITDCDNTELDGRPIRVRADRGPGRSTSKQSVQRQQQQPEPATQDSNKPKRRNREEAKGCRLFVSNLAWSTNWQGLKEHFKSAGEVLYANVLMQYNSDRSKGCGVVEMATPEEAETAMSTLNETELDGRFILVREDRDKGDRARKEESNY